MLKSQFLSHPLLAHLEKINLREEMLPWELVDLIEQAVNDYSNDQSSALKAILNIAAPKFTECNSLSHEFPGHLVIQHNTEVLLLVTMNLTMSLMSHPSKKAS